MIFLWYPKCSTCQKAYKKIEELRIKVELRDIKENNPKQDELKKWFKMSNQELKKFFNTSGLIYKELNLKEKLSNMTEEEKISLLSSNGMLVKRPLLINEEKEIVIIGYKENLYEELLKK